MLKQQRIRKSMASLMAGQFVNYGVMLVQTPYLTRHLSPEGFGVYSFANTLFLVSVYVVGYAVGNTGTFLFRKHATQPVRRSIVFWNQVGLQFIIAAMLSAGLLVWLTLSPRMKADTPVYLILIVNFFSTALYCPWTLAALEKFQAITMSATGARVATLVLMVLTVKDPSDVSWATAAVVIPNVIITIVYYIWVLRAGVILPLPFRHWHPAKVFKRDFFIAMNVYAVTAYTYIGMIVAKFLIDGHEYGLLAFADRFRWFIQVIVPTLGGVLFSRYCGERTISADRGARFGTKAVGLLIAFGIAAGAGLAAFVDPAIHILGGSQFLEARPLLYVVAASLPLIGINYYLTFFVVNVFNFGKQQVVAILLAAAAVVAALLLVRPSTPLYIISVIAGGELGRALLSWWIIHRSGMHAFRPGLRRDQAIRTEA